MQLFESRADLEYYCSLVMRLRVVKDLTSNDQQAILAYIILFNMSSDEAVSHVPKVSLNPLRAARYHGWRCLGRHKHWSLF